MRPRYNRGVQIRELKIPDSYEIAPKPFEDDRGLFMEWFRQDLLEQATGHRFSLKQANSSVSKRSVVRGVHFASLPPGQAKYVTVSSGAILDFVVDTRLGSPTFGQWDSVSLDSVERHAVYIAEGLGHAFVALTETAVVSYLVSSTYVPAREHGIDPTDPTLSLQFPVGVEDLVMSPKDSAGPSLESAMEQGLLPTWDECRQFYASKSVEVY